jgi:hypothetical protein
MIHELIFLEWLEDRSSVHWVHDETVHEVERTHNATFDNNDVCTGSPLYFNQRRAIELAANGFPWRCGWGKYRLRRRGVLDELEPARSPQTAI